MLQWVHSYLSTMTMITARNEHLHTLRRARLGTKPTLFSGERFYLGAVVLWRCLSPPDKLAAFI